MKIFISYSGQRSKDTAEILGNWISQVIQAAEIWNFQKLDKGGRRHQVTYKELQLADFGIICLNKDNINSVWTSFEAGALSKHENSRVCTFLLDIDPLSNDSPLSQFEHTLFSKDEVKKLVETINKLVIEQNEKGLSEKSLDEVYETFWPKLEAQLDIIKSMATLNTSSSIDTKDSKPPEVSKQLNTSLKERIKPQSGEFEVDPRTQHSAEIRYTYNDDALTKLVIELLLPQKNKPS